MRFSTLFLHAAAPSTHQPTIVQRHLCTCRSSDDQNFETANVGVAVALFRTKGNVAQINMPPESVLLVKRGKQPNLGLWALPGGRLGHGESLFDGAARELQEETGISSTDVQLKPHPIDTVIVSVQDAPPWQLHIFAGFEISPTNPMAADDAADAKFYPIAQVNELPLVEGLQATITNAIRNLYQL